MKPPRSDAFKQPPPLHAELIWNVNCTGSQIGFVLWILSSPPPQSSHHTMKPFFKLICVCLFKTKLDKQLPNTFSWIHVICFRCFLFQFLTNVSFQKLRMRPFPRREIQKYRGAVCRQSNRECLNPLGMCERCCFGGGDLRGEIDQAAAKKLLLRCFHLGRPINHLAACKWPPHIELII